MKYGKNSLEQEIERNKTIYVIESPGGHFTEYATLSVARGRVTAATRYRNNRSEYKIHKVTFAVENIEELEA